MKTTINFNIHGKHEFHSGEATIVDSYNEGITIAGNNVSIFNGELKTNLIGGLDGYKIYENYSDSGSNDYYYFAIKIN